MTNITDFTGNIYGYNEENGLLSKNDRILSSTEYEPLFINYPDSSEPPVFVGIYFKTTNEVLGMSGKLSKIIDSNTL